MEMMRQATLNGNDATLLLKYLVPNIECGALLDKFGS